ncbi:hypothetical protein GDO78_019018 [Eleutherodactylus coqui]|uniref:Uncharacterized protein n=1 Tax=Eleutherodactylus coqui TaxID=57060 RepID=A0A8J6C2C4_ELECQ|nr:hypothetical protein GDO78_019018 [Eleutherodactylus coqui]
MRKILKISSTLLSCGKIRCKPASCEHGLIVLFASAGNPLRTRRAKYTAPCPGLKTLPIVKLLRHFKPSALQSIRGRTGY